MAGRISRPRPGATTFRSRSCRKGVPRRLHEDHERAAGPRRVPTRSSPSSRRSCARRRPSSPCAARTSSSTSAPHGPSSDAAEPARRWRQGVRGQDARATELTQQGVEGTVKTLMALRWLRIARGARALDGLRGHLRANAGGQGGNSHARAVLNALCEAAAEMLAGARRRGGGAELGPTRSYPAGATSSQNRGEAQSKAREAFEGADFLLGDGMASSATQAPGNREVAYLTATTTKVIAAVWRPDGLRTGARPRHRGATVARHGRRRHPRRPEAGRVQRSSRTRASAPEPDAARASSATSSRWQRNTRRPWPRRMGDRITNGGGDAARGSRRSCCDSRTPRGTPFSHAYTSEVGPAAARPPTRQRGESDGHDKVEALSWSCSAGADGRRQGRACQKAH